MPLQLRVNISLSAPTIAALQTELTTAMSGITGHPPSTIAIEVAADQHLSIGGSTEPAAIIDFYRVAARSRPPEESSDKRNDSCSDDINDGGGDARIRPVEVEQNTAITEAVTALLQKHCAAIPRDQCCFLFAETPRHGFGCAGATLVNLSS